MTVRPLKESKIEYFTSIEEMPIWNWFKIHSTNNIKFVCKSDPGDLSVKQVKELEAAFENINGEFIDTFGISEDFRKILDLRREITWLKVDMMETGDKSLQNFIDMRESDLREVINGTRGDDYMEVKAHVEKFMGFKMNDKEVTVREYYTYIKVIKNEAKKTAVKNG